MYNLFRRDATLVLLLAFCVRTAGVLLTTVTNINPDQGRDTAEFARVAEGYASSDLTIVYLIENFGDVYATWGFVISPFWVLPGPSQVYARFGVTLVGAFAIYNIYLIVRHHGSRQAAAFAVAPLLVLPSFVAIHSVILRDTAILCGLTYAIRLIVVSNRWSTGPKYALALLAIGFASLMRPANLPIYAVMLLVWGFVWGISNRHYGGVSLSGTILGLFIYFVDEIAHWLNILRGHDSVLKFLIFMRDARIGEGGRTQYLADITLATLMDVLLYTPRGAVYFLFAPFPWLIESAIDYIALVESFVTLAFAIAGVSGLVRLWQRRPQLAGSLLIGLTTAAVFYGIISTNVGTSVRQRQVFTWIIFVFGGIGFAGRYHVRVIWPWRDETTATDTTAAD